MSNIIPTSEVSSPPVHPKSKKGIPIERIIQLAELGNSHQDIAELLGCDRSNITKRLNAYGYDKNELAHFKKHRADIMASDQIRYRSHITEAKLQKASAADLNKMITFKYNDERVERGLSTSNVAYLDVSKNIKDLDKEIEELEGIEVEVEVIEE